VPFELLVSLRYLREGRGQTLLILAGVAAGVGVIVFLSALITGLQQSLIARTLGTQAQVVVRPPEEMPRVLVAPGASPVEIRVERPAQRVRSIVQWQRARDEIARLSGVVAVAPSISGSAVVVRGQAVRAVVVRGIEAAAYRRIVPIDSFLVAGRLDLDGFKAVIGTELARELGLSVGNRLLLDPGTSSGDAARSVYTVSGIFDIGNRDLNQRWVFISLRGAQSFFGLEGGVSAIEVKGRGIFEAERLAREIADRTGLDAESWMEANAQLLTGLRSQQASSIMIQVFVVLAVALGIASVLAVAAVQKSGEIGILRATGTSTGQVMRIFLLQGAIVGLLGSAAGILLGVALGEFFSRISLQPDGTPRFPMALDAVLYLRTAAIAVAVGVSAALLPARRAARMDPAAVIRAG
jgi:lipoprotein-releasing system permease protein